MEAVCVLLLLLSCCSLSGAQVESSSEGNVTNKIPHCFDDKVGNLMKELMESLGEVAGTTGSRSDIYTVLRELSAKVENLEKAGNGE